MLRAALAVDGFVLFVALCAAANNNDGLAWLLLLSLAGVTGLALRYATKQGYWFVRRIERTWAHTCAGLGGNFVGEGNDYIASIREGFRSRGRYNVPTQTKVIYPELKNVRGHDNVRSHDQAWTAEVRFFDGQTIEQYNKHADAFALAFQVPYVGFELADNGLILMRCGAVQVPEAYEYRDLPGAAVQSFNVGPVPVAVDIAGNPFYLPIEGNHLLIIGRTGAGKSSWIWSLVFGLKNAREAGLVRLWALDPKRVELAYGRQWWDEYADTVEGMLELLEKAHDEVLQRNAAIQGKARKITANPEMPLIVIIIDELAYLSAAVDKKTHERAQRAMRAILWLGRATGYCLVGASQDPTKEVLSERDYFPTKVALGMEAPMVDLVLGKGAYEAGAHCEKIPLREAGAGCAYVKDELSSKPVLVRAAWCSDADIKSMPMTQSQQFLPGYQQGYGPQSGF